MLPSKLMAFVFTAAVVAGGFFVSTRRAPSLASAEPFSPETIVAELNRHRPSSAPSLAVDSELTQWMESWVPADSAEARTVTAAVLLERLQASVEGVAAASAGVFTSSPDRSKLLKELADWEEPKESFYTHLAVVTREDQEAGHTSVWALLIQRLSRFSPTLLGEGLKHFHHKCAHCSRSYNGQIYGVDRILVLRCPHCDQNYDILAVNTRNQYQRANDFFSHLTLPAAFPETMSPREEMESIWKRVLDHCQYQTDHDTDNFGPAKDSWQTSAETLQRRSGDCEDTSILLADWLISRGIDARVVIGETTALQGHSWCVARVEGEVYLLETTVDSDEAPEHAPLAAELADRYRPEYLFDRDRLYFFTDARDQDRGNLWDENLWRGVAYETVPPGLSTTGITATATGAPWFAEADVLEVATKPGIAVGTKTTPSP